MKSGASNTKSTRTTRLKTMRTDKTGKKAMTVDAIMTAGDEVLFYVVASESLQTDPTEHTKKKTWCVEGVALCATHFDCITRSRASFEGKGNDDVHPTQSFDSDDESEEEEIERVFTLGFRVWGVGSGLCAQGRL